MRAISADAQKTCRRKQLGVWPGANDDYASYSRNLGGHRRHYQSRYQRVTTAGNVAADGFDRAAPSGRSLTPGSTSMVQGRGNCFSATRRTLFAACSRARKKVLADTSRCGADLTARNPNALVREIDPVQFLCPSEQRRIPAPPHVAQRCARRPARLERRADGVPARVASPPPV